MKKETEGVWVNSGAGNYYRGYKKHFVSKGNKLPKWLNILLGVLAFLAVALLILLLNWLENLR